MKMFRTLRAATVMLAAISLNSACNSRRRGRAAGVSADAGRDRSRARMMPIEDATEYVATLKSLRSTAIQPQIDGQITRDLREVRRPRAPGRARSCRSIRGGSRRRCRARRPSAPRREAGVAFARQQRSARASCFAAGAISKQELEQAETALRTAEADLQSLQAQVQQQEVQLRYFTVTAPTAGVVGDVPVRVGNQVTPQTVLTTIDQNETLEVYVSVPIERAGELKNGLPIRMLSSDGARDARRRPSSISFRRTSTIRRSRCWSKAQVRNPDGDAARVAVRPRAHRLEDGRRPGRSGDRRAAHQRSVLRVRRRRRRTASCVARSSARSRSARSSATTIRCSRASSPASASSSPARRSSPTARRLQAARQPPPVPAANP